MSEPPSATSASDSSESRLPALGPRGEGWFLLQLVFLALIVAAGLLFPANWSGAPRFAAAVAGGALILGGIALLFRGVRDLDRSLSPMPRPNDDAVLITDGIYRRIRHPIYAALILLGFGWGLVMASWAALGIAVVLALVLDLKARREEVWLRERFPGYSAYAARTHRFVPGIY